MLNTVREGYRRNEELVLGKELGNGHYACLQRTDVVTRFLLQFFAQELGNEHPSYPYAIFVHSATGRGQLCPNSDIELVLVHPDGIPVCDPFFKKYDDSVVYKMPHTFGHKSSIHSLSGVPLSETRKDKPGLRTHQSRSMMDMHMLVGDARFSFEVYNRFKYYTNPNDFIDDRLVEHQEEIRQYPATNSHAPFNIKWGRGSLSHFNRAVSILGLEGYEPSTIVYQRLPPEVMESVYLLLKARAWVNLRKGLTTDKFLELRPGDDRTLDEFLQPDVQAFDEHFGTGSTKLLGDARAVVNNFAEGILK